MSELDTYRKHAKLLVRWHRDGNYSIGERLRKLERFSGLTDRQVLDMAFPLALAQEIVATEAGYPSWAELKSVKNKEAPKSRRAEAVLELKQSIPVLYVSDVGASAVFYRDQLGFEIDFLHGEPPFYGAVRRGEAWLHLRFVHEPVLDARLVEAEGLIMAFVAVSNAKALFAEYQAKGVRFSQRLTKQAWGGTDFHILDPDNNRIAFVG